LLIHTAKTKLFNTSSHILLNRNALTIIEGKF